MEDLVKLIVDNGLGIGSFIALIIFIFKYQDKSNESMKKIADTMVQIQISMATITDRIDKIEEKINKKEEN